MASEPSRSSRARMKFWGVEVKSGQSVVVEPGSTMLHLSQACLDDLKKPNGNDSVEVFMKSGDQVFVIGHLCADKTPQLCFDLFLCDKFELSHNWKNGSVQFSGYSTALGLGPLDRNAQPKMSLHESDLKVSSSDDDDESEDEESEDEESEDVESEDGESDQIVEDSGEDDECIENEEEDEETPKKVDVSKKRPAETPETESSKPPVEKKAKFVFPEGNCDFRISQVLGGDFRCDPCNRSFNSNGELQSHLKEKHGAAK